MRTTCRQIMALLLALVLLLSLCGCGQMLQTGLEQLGISLDKGNEESKDAGESQSTTSRLPLKRPGTQSGTSSQPEGAPSSPAQVKFTASGRQSLDQLRQQMQLPEILMGAAYLGYADTIPARQPAARWLPELNREMTGQYPFMTELDTTHIIGSGGHLYCIAPLDEQATLAINLVEWDGMTGKSKVTQVLYRSESGEPVLLFDNGSAGTGTGLQIQITDSKGRTCEWQPLLDGEGRLTSCPDQKGNNVLFDFTEYGQTNSADGQNLPAEFIDWINQGWGGLTALGLAGEPGAGAGGTGWFTQAEAWDTGRKANFYLWFFAGDETGGQVTLDWAFVGDSYYAEMWSGFWTIETVMDGPSYVTIDLSLVGGEHYGVIDGPYYLSGTYPIVASPSGLELGVGTDANGVALPFMSQKVVETNTPCRMLLIGVDNGWFDDVNEIRSEYDGYNYDSYHGSTGSSGSTGNTIEIPPEDMTPWLNQGWLGPTALGLAGSEIRGQYWYVHTTSENIGQEGIFYLWLQYSDDTGGALMLDWISDDGSIEEVWNGYWAIETAMDAPSRLRVTVSLDDNPYGVFLSEVYPILISPSGIELVVGHGENWIDMPCLAPMTVDGPCTLTLLDGFE